MPEARHNNSKLAEMFVSASCFSALVGMAVDVVSLFMALLSSVESAPRAYRLKASNAASPFSTSIGTIPSLKKRFENGSKSSAVVLHQYLAPRFRAALAARVDRIADTW